MQELNDRALLREFVEHDREEAFATLVARHIDRVYSIALRHTRNPHQAEEITQAVFVILAKKSRHLRKGVILEGWLFQTTRLTAITHIRSAFRRARREQEALMQIELNENKSETWEQIAPFLDEALASLNETDRNAVVLRFFYDKNMREIGEVIGGSEDKARMRINRTMEKLRSFFLKRGVSSTTAIIAGALTANSVQPAPALLAKTAASVAVAKGATGCGSTLTLIKGLKVMAWTKVKTAMVVAIVIICAGTSTLWLLHNHQRPKVPTELARALWKFSGYATPEDAMQSSAWAVRIGDTKAFLNSVTPEFRDWIESTFRGKPEIVVDGLNGVSSETTSYRIVTRNQKSDNVVLLFIHFLTVDGTSHGESVPLIKVGSEWKVGSPKQLAEN